MMAHFTTFPFDKPHYVLVMQRGTFMGLVGPHDNHQLATEEMRAIFAEAKKHSIAGISLFVTPATLPDEFEF